MRVSSADGSFSLVPPSGWSVNTSYTMPDGTKTVLVVAGPVDSGIQAHLIVVVNKIYVEPSMLKEEWNRRVELGTVQQIGAVEDTLLGGLPAVRAQYQASDGDIEYLTTDRGGKTYLFSFSASLSQFQRLWTTEVQKMLSSLTWSGA